MQTLSSVCQRPGRNGYYLRVAVPKPLREKFTNSIVRKLGNTHREALTNKPKVEAQIQREIGAALHNLSLVEEVQTFYNSPNSEYHRQELSLSELPEADKKDIRTAFDIEVDEEGNATDPKVEALWLALEGKSTWQMWVNRRAKVEARAKSTVNNWRSRLRLLAQWAKTDYLSELSKQQAITYKEHLLAQGHEPSSVKNAIGCLSGFWNWCIEHEIVQKNIWSGLKKRLPGPDKKSLPSDEIVKAATKKAATITSHRKKKDYQFLIQRYTGCRKGEAAGLRHSDIDLKEKVIRFIQWEQWVEYEKIRGGKRREKQIRKFKTGNKDERVLPMNKALYESIQDMELEDNNNPVWPLRYKSIDDSWGSHHVSEYRSKYGFTSHELRRLAVTKLTLAGISPFIIYEITRHKIEGMSDVIQMYTRPTVDELKEAIEILT